MRRAVMIGGALVLLAATAGCGDENFLDAKTTSAWDVSNGDALPSLSLTSGQGLVTFYTQTRQGSCMFTNKESGIIDVAANLQDFDRAAMCGAILKLSGPKGVVLARIADSCPTCEGPGHFDVAGRSVFAQKFGPAVNGRYPIGYQLVRKKVGKLQLRVKEGSSPHWTALLVQQHSLPVAKVELRIRSHWVRLIRQPYNYWISPQAPGSGTRRVRVTLTNGEALVMRIDPTEAGKVFMAEKSL